MTVKKDTSPKSGSLPPLAQHRIHNGVTLEQIEEATKISKRFLRAIEAEEFQTLPGGIFARSYIRQYAAAIGFDEEELLARYQRATGKSDSEASGSPPSTGSREQGLKRSAIGFLRLLGGIRLL